MYICVLVTCLIMGNINALAVKRLSGLGSVNIVYCSDSFVCLPFSYCRTLLEHTEIQYCRWGSGEPHICCPKNEQKCGILKTNTGRKAISEHKVLDAAVGGTPLQTARFSPWMVAVGEIVNSTEVEWFCGGVLVTEKHVITAAHCAVRRNIEVVRVGELDFSKESENASPTDIPVAKIDIHPEYSPPSFYNDIAILKLVHTVTCNPFINFICLPKSNSNESYNGVIATLTGWGQVSFGGRASPILQQVKVLVVNNRECTHAYTRPDVRRFHYPHGIVDSQLCAGYPNGSRDACQGDSGGPLVFNDEGVHTLIGIISSGFGCGSRTFPGVYTRITAFLSWIQKHIQN